MMKIVRKIGRWMLILLILPIAYLLVALVCSCIPISSIDGDENKTHTLFLSTNGIHVDIILPVDEMTPPLLEGLDQDPDDLYYSFGWGDRNFFLTTPTWSDLTVESTMTSFIFDTPSLMYVSRAYYKRSDWIPVKITDSQNQKLQAYLLSTFQLDENNKKIVLEGRGYHHKDNFYESYGSYSCFSTCNSWVNSGLKESGMNACLWTPFDFGILWRYR